MNKIIIFFFCSLSLFTQSNTQAIYNHSDIEVSNIAASLSKDAINDLTNIENSAFSIYTNENTDQSIDLKLQRHWALILTNNKYELERNLKLFDALIDIHSINEELHNLSLEGAFIK